jgi:ubiquinone/menaquinone biosynthesis C-methylase UbiE
MPIVVLTASSMHIRCHLCTLLVNKQDGHSAQCTCSGTTDVASNSSMQMLPTAGFNVQQGLATHMPYTAASFSAVVVLDAAYHFDTRCAFFNEACRVLQVHESQLTI